MPSGDDPTGMRADATAIAHPNIALVKYWGKRPGRYNLPAAGSLSITLDTLRTRTRLRFGAELREDKLVLDGHVAAAPIAARTSEFLDLVRQRAGTALRAEVHSDNNFPTGAGLASSASGFAALAVAATAALRVPMSAVELSALARQGSGSAARSIFGGFVQMHAGDHSGDKHDGDDPNNAVAEPILPARDWPLYVVIGVTDTAAKAVGSTAGMQRTRDTAPYYDAWIRSVGADLVAARVAIVARDFDALASVSEHSCLKMHGVAMAARPPLLYWNASTLAGILAVQTLRQQGVPVFFTVDAGPQIKAVCLPEVVATVRDTLTALPGVKEVYVAGLGEGARRVDASEIPVSANAGSAYLKDSPS